VYNSSVSTSVGTLQYSQCKHKENPRGAQDRSILHCGKLKAKFLEMERRWDEVVKRGEMQYEDFFK